MSETIQPIIMHSKDSATSYKEISPKSNAQNIIRDTKDITYLDGDTLLEVVQNMTNEYVAPNGEKWYNVETEQAYLTPEARICGIDEFVCILSPYNTSNSHYMYMAVSYDGGTTWTAGGYANSNTDNQINHIIGAEASRNSGGYYEVVLMGQNSTDARYIVTYKLFFSSASSTVPASAILFSNQIDTQ